MRKLSAIFLAVLLGMVISVGGSAQKGQNDNRPPKEDQRIKERDKPPPSNTNNQSNTNRKKP